MKLFTAQQLGQADKITIEKEGISSLDLMERAATNAFNHLIKLISSKKKPVSVFCGTGNNGGDGLVIARKFIESGWPTEVYVAAYTKKQSPDFKANMNRLKKIGAGHIQFINGEDGFPPIEKGQLVIDALFGIGLNRPLSDWMVGLVRHINFSDAFVVSIDMPSGLFADRIPPKDQVVEADMTLTFERPKLVFYLPQTAEFAGKVEVIPIGLDQGFMGKAESVAELVGEDEASRLRKPRARFSHKGTYGHTLLIGGSYGKMGSMVLASRAALRSGAGKATAMVPKCGYGILQIACPEAMVLTTDFENYLVDFHKPEFAPDAICFGMGAGMEHGTATFLKALLKATKTPMLIDADGLNLLARHRDLLNRIPKNSVLTPHPKELERLIGKWDGDFEKIKKTKAFAEEYQVVVVVKGANTITVSNGRIFINSTGNPGMATAGSGDVLSGLISGLMAQGYLPEEAAILGVYLHGKAGDLMAVKSSPEAMVAGDLIDGFGEAFRTL